MNMPSVSRRNLLRGRTRVEPRPRLPWARDRAYLADCTGCGDCVSACEEQILRIDPHGKAFVDFDRGECTFCGDCTDTCQEDLFDLTGPAFDHIAEISTACMLHAGISCQLCTDACDTEAITMDLSHRPVGAIRLNVAACTGCGGCQSMCPTSAISMQAQPSQNGPAQKETAH